MMLTKMAYQTTKPDGMTRPGDIHEFVMSHDDVMGDRRWGEGVLIDGRVDTDIAMVPLSRRRPFMVERWGRARAVHP